MADVAVGNGRTATEPVAAVAGRAEPRLAVAMVSTHATQCGIADYTDDLVHGLAGAGVASTRLVVDRSRLRHMTERELSAAFAELADAADGSDVVHVQHEYGFFAGAYGWGVSLRVFRRFLDRLRRDGRRPVVVTMHTEPVFLNESVRSAMDRARHLGRRRLWSSLMRSVAHDPAVRLVVHSRTTRRHLLDSGASPAVVAVIGQGRPAPMRPDPAAAAAVRQRLGIPADATVLSIFGFMSRYKGYHLALEALRSLPDDHHLLILGGPHPFSSESALEDVLVHLARHRRLRPRVHIAGFVPGSELVAHTAATDIFLAPYLASPRLSSSAALSRGLASGRPVVASRIPAFEELNDTTGCLELVNVERPRELAWTVAALAADEGRRTRLVEAALRHCTENSWHEKALEHVDLYRSLLARV